MLESALPLLHSLATCLAGSSSCLTQHWQSGPGQQHSGWLESAWPFASLNLPLQYSSLNTGSLSLCTARQQLSSSFWTCLGSSSSSSLASWSKLFWVSMCCYVLEDEFQKNRGYKFETLPLYVHWQPGRCSCMCQSYDLWLAASLTCSCLAGVTIFFWVLQQYCNAHIAQCCWGLGPVASSLTRAQWRTQQQFEWHSNNQDGTIIMEGLFLLCCCNDVCYEVTIHFCTQKIFFPKVYEKRSLVLTQQVTDYGFPIMAILRIGINEAQPKNLNGNAQLCKSGHISFAVFGCWVVFLQILVFLPILIDWFFYRSCKSKPAQWASIWKFNENVQFSKLKF